MSREIDCDPGEVVNLNGEGSMLLIDAVKLVMRSRRAWKEPIIFRKGYKRPAILNIAEIEQLAPRVQNFARPGPKRKKTRLWA